MSDSTRIPVDFDTPVGVQVERLREDAQIEVNAELVATNRALVAERDQLRAEVAEVRRKRAIEVLDLTEERDALRELAGELARALRRHGPPEPGETVCDWWCTEDDDLLARSSLALGVQCR